MAINHLVWNIFQPYKELTFKKYETIVRAEEEQFYLYYLESGFVRQYLLSPEGQELTLNIFKPGSYFYAAWALGMDERKYFFEAIGQVKVRKAPRVEVNRLFMERPEMMMELTKRLISGLQATTERAESLAFGNARQRVAMVIYGLARRFGEIKDSQPITIKLPMTHKLVASMAGLARETTSLEIELMREQKIISNQGRTMVVLDLERLGGETGMI
jgi:CRP/FNR family transcriptional regulator, dissimilatory nitrate respiration regulator